MTLWRTKVHTVIAELSMQAYLAANSRPRARTRHVPYTIPALAEQLVICLKTNDEEQAKSLMMRHAILGKETTTA